MGTLTCTIDGVAVEIMAGSFRVSETLNNRPVASFVLRFDATHEGNEGDEVIVTRISDSVKVFAGRVQQITLTTDESGNANFANYSCAGYEVLADRRLIAEVYRNKTAGFIVNNIITNYLAADGITAGTIETGAFIPRATFAYVQASQVLRELAEANGLVWYISYDKELFFVERDFATAPYEIDQTDATKRAVRGVVATGSLNQYRNRQMVSYEELTAVRTETFAGDGFTQTFGVEFPIALVPTVSVNGVAQTVGIGGLEDGKQWYWNRGANEIAQELTDAPLFGLDPFSRARQELLPYERPVTSFTLLSGLHLWGEYLVAGFRDTNGGYVLYKRNGTAWEQVNNLTVFTGRRVNRIIGFGDYFLSLETYGIDSFDVLIYRIVSDTITLVNIPVVDVPAVTALRSYYYIQANGKHVAVSDALGGLNTVLRVDIIATNGTITNATGTGSGLTLANRFFAGYHEAFCFVIDNNANSLAGGTLRQLSITDSVYAIATDPSNLTGDFDGGYASTNGYAFFRTSAGIEPYQRDMQSATLTKLAVITPPIGYTFSDTSTNGIFSQMGVYDDWLLVPVDEAPYLLTYRIDRVNVAVDYIGAYDTGISEAPRFVTTGADAAFVGAYDSDEIAGVFTAAKDADVLTVTYQGSFPNILVYDDLPEIAARAALEGGTGIYEAFQSGTDVLGDTAALTVAQAIIERYGRVPRTFSFQTLLDGFVAGQIVTVNWPTLGFTADEMLIERIDVIDESATNLWYRLRCISGRDIGNWQEFWRSIQPRSTFNFGGSDILPKGASVAEEISILDTVTAISAATETDWDEGNWDEMEWQ